MKALMSGWRGFLLALALNSLPLLLAAQERIEIGMRVRITGAAVSGAVPSSVTGNVLAVRADSLWLQPENRTGPQGLPLGSIGRLEVSMGRSSRGGEGARTGAIVGGVALATASYLDARACEPEPLAGFLGDCPAAAPSAFLGLVIGAAIGGGIGYLIGSQSSTERWRVVPLTGSQDASGQIMTVPFAVSLVFAPPAGRDRD